MATPMSAAAVPMAHLMVAHVWRSRSMMARSAAVYIRRWCPGVVLMARLSPESTERWRGARMPDPDQAGNQPADQPRMRTNRRPLIVWTGVGFGHSGRRRKTDPARRASSSTSFSSARRPTSKQRSLADSEVTSWCSSVALIPVCSVKAYEASRRLGEEVLLDLLVSLPDDRRIAQALNA